MLLHRYNEKCFRTNKFTNFFHFELSQLSWVAKSTKITSTTIILLQAMAWEMNMISPMQCTRYDEFVEEITP
jgi:hypothetical protein